MHPFADWTVEQLLSLVAGIVGVVMMLMAMRRDAQSDRDRVDARAAAAGPTQHVTRRSRTWRARRAGRYKD